MSGNFTDVYSRGFDLGEEYEKLNLPRDTLRDHKKEKHVKRHIRAVHKDEVTSHGVTIHFGKWQHVCATNS